MSTIDEIADRILAVLAERPRDGETLVSGEDLTETTGLSPHEINDAVAILVDADLVRWLQAIGTAPYDFAAVELTPRGRHQYARSLERVGMPELRDLITLRKP